MIDPLGNFGEFIETTPSEIIVNRYTFLLPTRKLKKNCNPLENYKKMLTPSEIFLSQPPSEISTWHPLRNSEFQTPSENLVNRGVWILNGGPKVNNTSGV